MPFTPFTGIDTLLTVPVNLQAASGPVFGAGTTGDAFNRVQMAANGNLSFGPGASVPQVTLSRAAAGVLGCNSVFDVTNVGSGLQVAEGTNAKQGTAVLVAGTVTVANTSVTANSRIFLTSNADGGTVGFLRVSARVAGTSFTITSSSATDTSTIAYEIFEPG